MFDTQTFGKTARESLIRMNEKLPETQKLFAKKLVSMKFIKAKYNEIDAILRDTEKRRELVLHMHTFKEATRQKFSDKLAKVMLKKDFLKSSTKFHVSYADLKFHTVVTLFDSFEPIFCASA